MSCISLCSIARRFLLLFHCSPVFPAHSLPWQLRRQRHSMTANSNRIGSLLKYWKALKNCLPGNSRLLPAPLHPNIKLPFNPCTSVYFIFPFYLSASFYCCCFCQFAAYAKRHKNPKKSKTTKSLGRSKRLEKYPKLL